MRNSLIFIAILIAAIIIFSIFFPGLSSKTTEIPITDVVTLSQQHQIKNIEVDGDTLTITKVDNTQVKSFKENNANIYDIKGLDLTGVTVDVKGSGGIIWGSLLINFLPLILFGVLLFFLFRSASRIVAMSFCEPRSW